MNRRKIAFAQLSISFYITVCILTFHLIVSFPRILVPCFVIFAIIIVLLILVVNKMLTKQSGWEISLSSEKIVREFKNTVEQYPINDIKSIRIKRNCKGFIREIRFRMAGTKTFFINGLEDFENFREELLEFAKDAQVINYKEPPIDYDHWLFYPLLGPVLGIISTLFIKLLLSVGESNIKYIQLILAAYLIMVGIFFIISQPVRSRYGNKNRKIDIIFGVILSLIGAAVILSLII